MAPGQGMFPVNSGTVVRVPAGDAEAAGAARYLVEKVARTRGLKLSVQAFDAAGGGAAAAVSVGGSAGADAAGRSSSARDPVNGAVPGRDAVARDAAAHDAAAASASAASATPGVAFIREPGMPNDALSPSRVASHGDRNPCHLRLRSLSRRSHAVAAATRRQRPGDDLGANHHRYAPHTPGAA